jgi:hypothetical protein
MQRKKQNIFLIFTSECSIQNKKLLACFSVGNKVEIPVNSGKEIRFPILNKEGHVDCFEVE